MTTTHISAIVPAYNEAAFLSRSLGSLYHSAICLGDTASLVSAELIVANNGSVDSTAALAQTYGARVVTVPRRGVAHARNAGARAATGEVLIFVDADYRVPHHFLGTVAGRFAADSRLCAAGVTVRLEPSEIDPANNLSAGLALWALRRLGASFGVFAFRRDYFQRLNGFDESLLAYEDVDLLRRIRQDVRSGRARYEVIESVVVHASARGFYRRRMRSTYVRMALSRSARRDPSRCGYWYDR
jgi:glycosyltransferase involved in cell wall biosynthesis